MDPERAPPRKRRIDASSSIFRQVRGVIDDRKAFHDDPDAAKHKLARWQSAQRKAAPAAASSAPVAASSAPVAASSAPAANASSSWQDLEGLGRPRVSDDQVATFVSEKFGLEVTAISRLTGERDLNFRATAGGRSYVVKVANASESRAQLECEHAAMLHVAGHLARHGGGPPLETPTPLELCGEEGEGKGGTIACIEAAGGARHLVRVLSYLEGRMWSSCAAAGALAADFAASLGRTAALLDGAMLSFAHPAAAREHAWDLAACQATVRAYLPEVGTELRGPEAEAARALVRHFAQLHEREVAPLLRSGALPRSAVHQDLNDNNVVCGAQGRVSGVIDFGDMSLTETCNNLAVALAYAFFGRPKPLEVLAEAVAPPHSLLCLTSRTVVTRALTFGCSRAPTTSGARLLGGACDLAGRAARALPSRVHARVHHRGHGGALGQARPGQRRVSHHLAGALVSQHTRGAGGRGAGARGRGGVLWQRPAWVAASPPQRPSHRSRRNAANAARPPQPLPRRHRARRRPSQCACRGLTRARLHGAGTCVGGAARPAHHRPAARHRRRPRGGRGSRGLRSVPPMEDAFSLPAVPAQNSRVFFAPSANFRHQGAQS